MEGYHKNPCLFAVRVSWKHWGVRRFLESIRPATLNEGTVHHMSLARLMSQTEIFRPSTLHTCSVRHFCICEPCAAQINARTPRVCPLCRRSVRGFLPCQVGPHISILHSADIASVPSHFSYFCYFPPVSTIIWIDSLIMYLLSGFSLSTFKLL